MISQSSIIAFFLLAGFVVFVTMRGELPSYAAVLGIGSSSATSSGDTIDSNGNTVNSEGKTAA